MGAPGRGGGGAGERGWGAGIFFIKSNIAILGTSLTICYHLT